MPRQRPFSGPRHQGGLTQLSAGRLRATCLTFDREVPARSLDALLAVASRRHPPTLLMGDRQATDGLNGFSASPGATARHASRRSIQWAVTASSINSETRGSLVTGLHTAQSCGDQAFHPFSHAL